MLVRHELQLINCNLPGSSVHGISKARILKWGAIPFSMGSSPPRDWTHVSCIAGRFFTICATRESPPCIAMQPIILFSALYLMSSYDVSCSETLSFPRVFRANLGPLLITIVHHISPCWGTFPQSPLSHFQLPLKRFLLKSLFCCCLICMFFGLCSLKIFTVFLLLLFLICGRQTK